MSVFENIKVLINPIRLSRVSVVYAALTHACFMIVATRLDQMYAGSKIFSISYGFLLIFAIMLALSFSTLASVLNDLLDNQLDLMVRSRSGIRAGEMAKNQAVVLAVGSILMGILSSVPFGTYSVYYALATAVLILFYDASARYVPALGSITLSMIVVLFMFIVNPSYSFVLPIFWMSCHVLLVSLAMSIVNTRRPHISFKSLLIVFLYMLLLGVILFLQGGSSLECLWPSEAARWKIFLPIFASFSFYFIARWKVCTAANSLSAAEKVRRYSALWQSVYVSCWFLILGFEVAALFALLSTVIAYLFLVLLREFIGLQPEKPLDFQA